MNAQIPKDVRSAHLAAHMQGRLVLPRIPESLQRWIFCIGIMAAAAAAGTVSALMDARYALRAALGLPVIVTLVRFRYVLLLTWVLISVFFGSTVPIFSGNNLDTALTVSLMVVMVALPGGLPQLVTLGLAGSRRS